MTRKSFYSSVRGVVLLAKLREPALSHWRSSAETAALEVRHTDDWDECHAKAGGNRPTCLVAQAGPLVDPRLVDASDSVYRRGVVIVICQEVEDVGFWQRVVWDAFPLNAPVETIEGALPEAMAEATRRSIEWDLVAEYYKQRESLSQDERRVLESVCAGKLNKQIANELGVSVRTVEQRRRRVFDKMGVESAVPLADRVATVRTLERRLLRRDRAQPGPAPKLFQSGGGAVSSDAAC